MGLRDIHAFNLAMLAKQAWRLIKSLHSLFYKVYKAQYFPNFSFMEAELGSKPSYVWRSLLMAREIIRKGTKWRVGDERHIEVTAHKFFTHDPVFLGAQPNRLFVRDLIDEDTRQWDQGKIHALFAPSTWKEILAIPLNNLNSSDELVWKETSAQNFTVKIAYKIALGLNNQTQGEHSQARQIVDSGKRCGDWMCPLRSGPFCGGLVWISYPLKTTCSAAKWGLNRGAKSASNTQRPPATCFGNVFWLGSRNVWSMASIRIQKCPNSAPDFFELFRKMVTRLNQQDLETWAVIVWALWNARNKFYFERTQLQPRHIYDAATWLLTEYQHHMAAQTTWVYASLLSSFHCCIFSSWPLFLWKLNYVI